MEHPTQSIPTKAEELRYSALRAGGTVMSSVASAQNFATRNGITTQPTPGEVPQGVSDDSTSVESLTWHANGTPLYCLCTVRGGGHVIPQPTYRFPRLLGKTTSLLNAPREAV